MRTLSIDAFITRIYATTTRVPMLNDDTIAATIQRSYMLRDGDPEIRKMASDPHMFYALKEGVRSWRRDAPPLLKSLKAANLIR
jgi:hypothetical protein